MLEVGLRAMGERLPSWVLASRLNLGEVHSDPRWQVGGLRPPSGPVAADRLRVAARRHRASGLDLVRHPAYRFPFVTDAEGFRNSEGAPLGTVVAALGDSFTDAMTLPVELGGLAQELLLAHVNDQE